MPKVRFPVGNDSDCECVGIDTADIIAFALDSNSILSLWFRGCEHSVPFTAVDLGAENFTTLLDFVIAEFPHINDAKLHAS